MNFFRAITSGRVRSSFALALAAALASTLAGASNATHVTIAQIVFNPTAAGNAVIIKVSPLPVNQPSCSTNIVYQYSLNLSGTAANQIYAALLSAMMAGKLVDISGLQTCTTEATVEDLRSLVVIQ
jgi:hypothetical protein